MPQIQDIAGAYCPMGCGETLHLMTGGLICCLGPDCPDQGAARQILADRESEHVVVFGADSYTILHPLRDRLGDLFSCTVHLLVQALPGPPGGDTGRYRARITDGELILEALPG
jgi:hypothetical protein